MAAAEPWVREPPAGAGLAPAWGLMAPVRKPQETLGGSGQRWPDTLAWETPSPNHTSAGPGGAGESPLKGWPGNGRGVLAREPQGTSSGSGADSGRAACQGNSGGCKVGAPGCGSSSRRAFTSPASANSLVRDTLGPEGAGPGGPTCTIKL